MALRSFLACLLLTCSLLAHAFETVRVTENVYALVGDLGQRSPANLGHNITSGFIVTDAGDTVFVDRLLGIMPGSAQRWIRSLEFLRDELKPRVIVPGHGRVTDLAQSLRDSYDYLVFLRGAIARRFADGAFDPVEASQNLDQSRFAYLQNYDDLSFRSRNALAMAEEIFQMQQK